MRLLLGLGAAGGWVLLGLFGAVELLLRCRADTTDGRGARGDEHGPGPSDPPVPVRRSRLRTVLGALGVATAGYGVYLVLRTVSWTSYPAIAIWLAAAVVLHDAVLVPAVSVLRAALLRAGRRLPVAALAVIEGAFVVCGVLSLVAVPEIWAQHLGPLNPTVLPGAYGQSLLVIWLVVAVVTAGVVATLALVARRGLPDSG